ncbi:MAG: tail fiber domain-containing protein [Salinivirgaceae bacterium]
MKKIAVVFFSLILVSFFGYSQIEVGSNNKVGIGVSGTVNSKLSINHVGSTGYTGYFYSLGNTGGIYTKIGVPASSSSWLYGIYSDARQSQGYLIGIWGQAYSSTTRSGDSFGVFGSAGNGAEGRNYAVYGRLEGTRNGAAIFGTTAYQVTVPDKYAGYFFGKTEVNGAFFVKGVQVQSDINSKKEVRELGKNNLEKLKKVNPIKFKYKTPIEMGFITSAVADTLSTEVLEQINEMSEKEHIGLSAQEIQTIYPELITQKPNGLLTIDYIGLVPILLEAIKEQQVAIENLTEEVNKIKRKSDKQ